MVENPFEGMRKQLGDLHRRVFTDDMAPRTVIVVPSLSLDAGELTKIQGVNHYEQRMLCTLTLLRLPRTQLIYLTSEAIDPAIIDYFLSLLAGIPFGHARRRLKLFHCHDASPQPLSEKLLKRPRLLQRIRNAVDFPDAVHMTCFTATDVEVTLAQALNAPLYACDPKLADLGSKSGSRETFRQAAIDLPAGEERLRTGPDVADALAHLKRAQPDAERAVVKLNEGFSGEGNAVFRYKGLSSSAEILEALPRQLKFEAAAENWPHFMQSMRLMGGITEAFVDGTDKRSPSVQCRINPIGEPEIISTHDQILGGPSGQIFLGATFPADPDYRLALHERGLAVANVLAKAGVMGRFAVDFVSVRDESGAWQHYAIEINLRKGGTTHPFIMLQYLTDGHYEIDTGRFMTHSGEERFYYATDNLQSEAYIGLLPQDLVDIVVENKLHFHGPSQRGVAFHLIGALSEFGKLGMLCIGDSPADARDLYERTVKVLDATQQQH